MHLGILHPVIVHFPIALGIAAALADLLWLLTRRAFFKHAGLYCLVGVLVVTPAVLLTGYLFLTSLDLSGDQADLAEDHEHAGFAVLGIAVGAALARLWWSRKPAAWLPWAYGVLMLALVVAVTVTAHLGGTLMWGKDYLSS